MSRFTAPSNASDSGPVGSQSNGLLKGSEEFVAAHRNGDLDFDRTSQHHTLGKGPLQAAPGNHDHADLQGSIDTHETRLDGHDTNINDLYNDNIANALNIDNHKAVNFAHLPIGTVIAWAGPTAPTGWFPCTGAAVSRTTYAALFTEIGTWYGVGDGSTTFNIPTKANSLRLGADIIKAS